MQTETWRRLTAVIKFFLRRAISFSTWSWTFWHLAFRTISWSRLWCSQSNWRCFCNSRCIACKSTAEPNVGHVLFTSYICLAALIVGWERLSWCSHDNTRQNNCISSVSQFVKKIANIPRCIGTRAESLWCSATTLVMCPWMLYNTPSNWLKLFSDWAEYIEQQTFQQICVLL